MEEDGLSCRQWPVGENWIEGVDAGGEQGAGRRSGSRYPYDKTMARAERQILTGRTGWQRQYLPLLQSFHTHPSGCRMPVIIISATTDEGVSAEVRLAGVASWQSLRQIRVDIRKQTTDRFPISAHKLRAGTRAALADVERISEQRKHRQAVVRDDRWRPGTVQRVQVDGRQRVQVDGRQFRRCS